MPKDGQSGLIIPVPEAEPLLAAVSSRHPEAVREGVPAHVSVLYPFLPVDELDAATSRALSEVFAVQPPLSVSFAEHDRRGDFVFVRPQPLAPLAELTERTRHRWPEIVPYEGRYEHVEPHLTVSMRTTETTAAAIDRELADELPVHACLREACLVTFTGGWTVRERFPFEGEERGR